MTSKLLKSLTATVKLESPNDVQELERLRILANKLRDWIRRRQPRCEESLYQVDGVRDGFEELAEMVCDDLGYYEEDQLKQKSKCDHVMTTTGSGTYCLKPDCDINWR